MAWPRNAGNEEGAAAEIPTRPTTVGKQAGLPVPKAGCLGRGMDCRADPLLFERVLIKAGCQARNRSPHGRVDVEALLEVPGSNNSIRSTGVCRPAAH